MNKEEKFEKLNAHIGWEQVSDIQQLDAECGDRPSTGKKLAGYLIENAQNQTGIPLESKEREELVKILAKQYD